MRRFELVIPSVALALLTIIAIPCNLRCRLFFPQGSTTRLAFSFGWPLPYLVGSVPGPGQPKGRGPNFVWGHPEFNDDPKIMESIRQRLSGVSLTPWKLGVHGRFHVLGLAINVLLIGCVWPILWWLCRRARVDRENRERFNDFSTRGRVRIQAGAFKDVIGRIEDVDIDKDRVSVRVQLSGQNVVLHLKPEEIENA